MHNNRSTLRRSLRHFSLAWCALFMLGVNVAKADVAPDFELRAVGSDNTVKLSELQGQIVLLDFWASWCVPCRASMAVLQTLQTEYAGKPVRIVPISVDEDSADAAAFLKKYGPELHSLQDPEGGVAEAYDLLGMPSSFVIDADGQLAMRHEGYRAGDEQKWRDAIDALLSASPTPALGPAVAANN